MKAPLEFFGELNEDLFDKFEKEVQEDVYVFTNNGNIFREAEEFINRAPDKKKHQQLAISTNCLTLLYISSGPIFLLTIIWLSTLCLD